MLIQDSRELHLQDISEKRVSYFRMYIHMYIYVYLYWILHHENIEYEYYDLQGSQNTLTYDWNLPNGGKVNL